MKRLGRVLVSRRFLVVLIALLQIGLFFGLTFLLSSRAAYVYNLLILLSVLGVAVVFDNDGMNPSYKIMWILLMVIFPVTGGLLYVMFGNRRLTPKRAAAIEKVEALSDRALIPQEGALHKMKEQLPAYLPHVRYLFGATRVPVYAGTEQEYFPEGELFFQRFCEELEKAEKFILLEYYIIDHGYMWDTILDILKRKAAAGVEVKLLYDGFGCLFTLDEDYPEVLSKYGIQCAVFNPIRINLHISDYMFLNHRDHRKICVIDGNVGFNGGLNLADEYINRKERFGHWKDTAYMIKGPAVFTLTVTFSKVWQIATGLSFPYENYLPTVAYPTNGFVQPFADTPLDGQPVSEFAYLNIINRAKKYVYITTPYLVIDNELLTALTLASKSGIDVRIITPGIPDKPYVYLLTQSYYKALLKAGVRIYEYTPGFIHSKMYLSDDEVAIVGSANMDYRSLYLHFESCGAFYGGPVTQGVKADILDTFEKSREVMLEDTLKVPLYKRAMQLVLRLFAPMM